MINFQNCTEKELWEFVAVELSKSGLKNVLVGGAVAAIYSEGIYKSGDLDFVIDSFLVTKKSIETAMSKIGFKKVSRHWVHPECNHLYVEFCNPPVSIGDEFPITPIEIQKEGVSIYILSPTDCVKDRLASYIHWNALECFDQAVWVAKANLINWPEIKKWCKSETVDGYKVYEKLRNSVDPLRPS